MALQFHEIIELASHMPCRQQEFEVRETVGLTGSLKFSHTLRKTLACYAKSCVEPFDF